MYYFNDLADVQNYLDTLVGISTTDDIMNVFYKQEKQKQQELSKSKAIIERYDFIVEENGNYLTALEKNEATFKYLKRILNSSGRTPKKELIRLIEMALEDINTVIED